jgi:hypothetical protein
MSDDVGNEAGMYVDDIWPVPSFAARRMVDTAIADTSHVMEQSVNGRYWYRVRGHNAAWGWSDYGPLEDILVGPPGIEQAQPGPGTTEFLTVAPSPFTNRVQVSYGLARTGVVTIAVFDAAGRHVRTLADKQRQPGVYCETWDGRDDRGRKLASGVYFVSMKTQSDQGFERSSARVVVTE